jgi:hypothetical protein
MSGASVNAEIMRLLDREAVCGFVTAAETQEAEKRSVHKGVSKTSVRSGG